MKTSANIMSAEEARACQADGDGVQFARMRDTIIALHDVLEGRTTPPTDAEIDERAIVGGRWRCVVPGLPRLNRDGMDDRETLALRSMLELAGKSAMWWALDADRRPCARRPT